MPQFDSSFFQSQVFWTLISFALLFFMLKRWVLPVIEATLAKRQAIIREDLAKAEDARREAAAFQAKYAAQLAEVDVEIRKRVIAAEADIKSRHQHRNHTFEQNLKRRKEGFLADEAFMHQQAIKEIQQQSTALIVDAAERLVHHTFNEADAQQALEEALADIKHDFPPSSKTD
ncbi:MAG: hypothetical protein AUK35_01250 [Zetaproteobacteria bacterium CG2_30_46_52]|nr:MAG: hypothetical protein AUK35_01250 [Zetaproteobacteria bacterium CG2_30_46_52]